MRRYDEGGRNVEASYPNVIRSPRSSAVASPSCTVLPDLAVSSQRAHDLPRRSELREVDPRSLAMCAASLCEARSSVSWGSGAGQRCDREARRARWHTYGCAKGSCEAERTKREG